MKNLCFVVLLLMSGVFGHSAEKWNLLPVKGNQPNKWEEGDNWRHAKSNPLKVEGGEWLLAFQDCEDPAPQFAYTAMQPGTYVNYYYVWKAGEGKEKDPRLCYRGMALKARPAKAGIHKSRAAAIIFAPESAGKYKVAISASVKVQNHTAGNAFVTFGVLSEDGKTFRMLKEASLNSDKTGAYGKYPSVLKIDESTDIVKGEKIVLRLQTASPGKASAGSSVLNFEKFEISKE